NPRVQTRVVACHGTHGLRRANSSTGWKSFDHAAIAPDDCLAGSKTADECMGRLVLGPGPTVVGPLDRQEGQLELPLVDTRRRHRRQREELPGRPAARLESARVLSFTRGELECHLSTQGSGPGWS